MRGQRLWNGFEEGRGKNWMFLKLGKPCVHMHNVLLRLRNGWVWKERVFEQEISFEEGKLLLWMNLWPCQRMIGECRSKGAQ